MSTSDLPAMTPEAMAVHKLTASLQVLSGAVAAGSPAEVIDACEAVAANVPEPTAEGERIIIDALLREALTRVLRAFGLKDPDLERGNMTGERFTEYVARLRGIRLHTMPWFVVRALAIMQRRFSEPTLTAAQVAKELKVSVWHLTRVLKRCTGSGFRSHLRRLRARHACELLDRSTLSVKEVAAAVGCSGASEFGRQFRTVTGITPSGFRQQRALGADRRCSGSPRGERSIAPSLNEESGSKITGTSVASGAPPLNSRTADYDVVVVGGSLAGCAAAISFASRNLRVAVLEQRPSMDAFKVMCTHFVQPMGVLWLRQVGLEESLAAAGLRTKAAFWTSAGWIDPPGDYGEGTLTVPALNIERRVLDPFLRRRLQDFGDVDLRLGHCVVGLARDGPDCVVHARIRKDTVAVRGRLVVAADGRSSRLAERLHNVGRYDANDRAAVFGYFDGIDLPDGNRSLFILSEPERGFLYPQRDGRTLAAVYVPKQDAARWLAPSAPSADLLMRYFRAFDGLPNLSRAKLVSRILGYTNYPSIAREPVCEGVAFVGDAALSLDPLSGVGCGFAMVSAAMLADATCDALTNGTGLEASLAGYASAFKERFLAHANGIAADSRITKAPESMERLYGTVIADPALQRAFVDLTGRIIAPQQFQRAYLAALRPRASTAARSSRAVPSGA